MPPNRKFFIGAPRAFLDRHVAAESKRSQWPRTLCRVPAFPYCEILSRQQKNPEGESVCNQEQRHYQSRKEECGSQLPSQQPGVIGLVESIEEISRTPDAEEPCDANASRTGEQ